MIHLVMGMLGSVRLIGRLMNKSRDEFIFHRSGFLDSFGYVRRLTYPKNCTKRYKWPKMIFLISHLLSNFFFWCAGMKVFCACCGLNQGCIMNRSADTQILLAQEIFQKWLVVWD